MALLLIKRMIAILLLQFLTINLLGQSTTNATISASITDVVGAINSSDIIFNSFLFGSNSETIKLNSKNIVERSSLIKSGTLTQEFSFAIIGNNYTYTITLPSSSILLKRKAGNETIQADMFNIILTTKQPDMYSQTLCISTTIIIPAIQLPGYYTPINPLLFTVHYN